MPYSETKFYVEQLEELVGNTISAVAIDDTEKTRDPVWGESFFGLVLDNGESKVVLWILRDEEGNGPGAFQVTEA